MSETKEAALARYQAELHGMQTGVRLMLDNEQLGVNGDVRRHLKHVRVGINSAMVEHSALAGLLIAAGVIDETAYFIALADKMAEERQRYEKEVREAYNSPNITLG